MYYTKPIKFQYRGHCPYCGTQRAVIYRTTHMSKHGYKVDNGWFSGICSGKDHRPMEEERTVAETVIDQILVETAGLRKQVQLIKDGKWHPAECPKAAFMPHPEMIPWSEASEYAHQNELECISRRAESRAKSGERFADFLRSTLEAVHGQKLEIVEVK